jgi:hypothetical protein
MAIAAIGRERIAAFLRSPVQALGILFGLVGMAGATVYGRQFLRMRKILGIDIGVAVCTFQSGVRRGA